LPVARIDHAAVLLQDFAIDIHLVGQRCCRLLLRHHLPLPLPLPLHLFEPEPPPLGIISPEALISAPVAAPRRHAGDAVEAISACVRLARRHLRCVLV
jgi:hypothetical protein